MGYIRPDKDGVPNISEVRKCALTSNFETVTIDGKEYKDYPTCPIGLNGIGYSTNETEEVWTGNYYYYVNPDGKMQCYNVSSIDQWSESRSIFKEPISKFPVVMLEWLIDGLIWRSEGIKNEKVPPRTWDIVRKYAIDEYGAEVIKSKPEYDFESPDRDLATINNRARHGVQSQEEREREMRERDERERQAYLSETARNNYIDSGIDGRNIRRRIEFDGGGRTQVRTNDSAVARTIELLFREMSNLNLKNEILKRMKKDLRLSDEIDINQI